MSLLSVFGKGLLTAVRVADAGASLYQVSEELWIMVDPDSRYPELREAMDKLTAFGTEYDGKLDVLIKKSNDLNNLANGLHVLNATVRLMDDKGVALFARYEKLAKYHESFGLKFPTLRNWFNDEWIRKNNLDPRAYKQLTSQANPSALQIVMQSGFITVGAVMTGIKIKSLVSMGLNAYQRHTGTMPTRARANAMVAPTGRLGKLQHSAQMLTVRYPRIYATIRTTALAASLGLNIYLIVDKIRRAEQQKEELLKQIDVMKKNIRYLDLFSAGAKNSKEVEELRAHYGLDVDVNNAEELQRGVAGLLSDYNENLAVSLNFIDETFAHLLSDASEVSVDESVQKAIRDDRATCKEMIDAIQSTGNGEVRKEKIDTLNEFTREKLVTRFEEWTAALDSVLEIENIRSMVAQEAVSLVEDLVEQEVPESKWLDRIARQSKRTFASVNAILPTRKVFLKEGDVMLLLRHFVEELTKHRQAA